MNLPFPMRPGASFTQIEEIQKAEKTIDSYGFDTGVLPFINQVIQEQDTGKALYCTGDGAQNLIVFYVSDDWAERFNEKAEWIELKKL